MHIIFTHPHTNTHTHAHTHTHTHTLIPKFTQAQTHPGIAIPQLVLLLQQSTRGGVTFGRRTDCDDEEEEREFESVK